MLVAPGATDVTTYFQMRTTAGADGTALTITDFDLSYTRTGASTAVKVDATALAAADAAHADNKMIEVDATDCPGLYRVDWPDAAFATGVREVILTVKHASCFTESVRVEIDGAQAAIDEAVDGSIETYHLDHLLAATYDPASKPGAADALLNEMVENDSGVSRLTANALEQAPDTTTGLTLHADYDAAKSAAAAGDEMDLVDAPNATAVAAIQSGLGTAANQTTLDGKADTIAGYLDTEIAAILEDTGTTIPGLIAALNDPTAAAVASAVWASVLDGTQTATDLLTLAVAGVIGKAVAYDTGDGSTKGLYLYATDGTTLIATVEFGVADGARTVTIE